MPAQMWFGVLKGDHLHRVAFPAFSEHVKRRCQEIPSSMERSPVSRRRTSPVKLGQAISKVDPENLATLGLDGEHGPQGFNHENRIS